MKFQRFSVGFAAAAMTLSLASAWAQDERGRPSGESGSRPSSGETVGSAVPRGGGGGESAASSAGATSSSPASPSNNGSASNPASSPSGWMDPGSSRVFAPRAPVRPDRADRMEARDQRSRPSGAESSGSAVPRGESGGGGPASGSTSSTNASSGSDNQPSSQGHSRAVPANSRPRGDRNQTGTAVDRTSPPYNGGGYYPSYPYYPYYPYYPWYYPGYYPWGYGGIGFGFSWYSPGFYGAGYGPYYGGGYYAHYDGAVRIKVQPSKAEVLVDGYYVGIVDEFDNPFQQLQLESGPHRIEVRADGYEPLSFEVRILPGKTITYKAELKKNP